MSSFYFYGPTFAGPFNGTTGTFSGNVTAGGTIAAQGAISSAAGFVAPNGSTSTTAYGFANGANYGLMFNQGASSTSIVAGGVEEVMVTSTGMAVAGAFSATTGTANFRRGNASQSTDYQVLATDSGSIQANTGAGSLRTFTLPLTASIGPGFWITFVNGANGAFLKILCNTGQTIQLNGGVTSSGGSITAKVVGQSITLCRVAGMSNVFFSTHDDLAANWTVA